MSKVKDVCPSLDFTLAANLQKLVSLSVEVHKLPPPMIAIAPKIRIIYFSSFQNIHKHFCVIDETV